MSSFSLLPHLLEKGLIKRILGQQFRNGIETNPLVQTAAILQGRQDLSGEDCDTAVDKSGREVVIVIADVLDRLAVSQALHVDQRVRDLHVGVFEQAVGLAHGDESLRGLVHDLDLQAQSLTMITCCSFAAETHCLEAELRDLLVEDRCETAVELGDV